MKSYYSSSKSDISKIFDMCYSDEDLEENLSTYLMNKAIFTIHPFNIKPTSHVIGLHYLSDQEMKKINKFFTIIFQRYLTLFSQ